MNPLKVKQNYIIQENGHSHNSNQQLRSILSYIFWQMEFWPSKSSLIQINDQTDNDRSPEDVVSSFLNSVRNEVGSWKPNTKDALLLH